MRKASAFFLLLTVLHSGFSQAENLKNSEFLEFTEGQRHWWYLGAYAALGHMALLEDKEKGRCILNWLYDDGEYSLTYSSCILTYCHFHKA